MGKNYFCPVFSFGKKIFLVDLLEGFIDIHNHILPGIDDGAKTSADSLEMIKALHNLGFDGLIHTPHIMSGVHPNTPETIKRAEENLSAHLDSNDLMIKRNIAAEHMIDENFNELLEKGGAMPLAQNYLLVEMSYLQASANLEDALQLSVKKGLYPILAHPERYLYYHKKPDYFRRLKKTERVFMQLNLLALGGYYGSQVQKMAYTLLDMNIYDFAATDAHHMRHINALKKIQLKKKDLPKIEHIIETTIGSFYNRAF